MAYALIGREDIAATLASNSSGSTSSNSTTGACATVLATDKAVPADRHHHSKQQQQHKVFEPLDIPYRPVSSMSGLHLLLPYQQRLLFPSGMCGQQIHLQPALGAHSTTATALSAASCRMPRAVQGLRSTGSHAASAPAAGVSGSSGAAAAPAAGSSTAGDLGKASAEGGIAAPTDGMECLVNGVSALRFSRDDRLAEARSLLGTNMPVIMQVRMPTCGPDRLPVLTPKRYWSCYASGSIDH